MNPIALFSLGLLILNDHILKHRYGNSITGKLSDIAGLIFFPLLVIVLIESCRKAFRKNRWQIDNEQVVIVFCIVAMGYLLVKCSQPIADAYSYVLGSAEWSLVAMKQACTGHSIDKLMPREVLADPTDLVALPAVGVAWLIVKRHNLSPGSNRSISISAKETM